MSRDIFISHSWGKDILNRPNHERAKYLSNLLVNQGYSVWFDEYDLIGNIDNAIIRSEFPLHNRFWCEQVDVWMTLQRDI